MKKNKVSMTVALLVGLVAMLAGIFIAQHMNVKTHDRFNEFNGTLLKKPRMISNFKLIGIDGQPFTQDSLKGSWTLLFFGFTHCEGVCPTIMAELAKTQHLLEDQGAKSYPKMMMISLDPKRDSLDRLKHYVQSFNPNFFGARGREQNVEALAKNLGIAYSRATGDNIEHTGTIILFNPQGQLIAFFTAPYQAASLAHDYLLLTQE